MSTHPNAVLLLTLTPDDLARKTWRSILEYANAYKRNEHGVIDEEEQITIGDNKYNRSVMESDYDEGMQIAAKEGDIVLYDMITYGYGEVMEWDTLEKQKNELEEWAKVVCIKFNCSYKIFITANYW